MATSDVVIGHAIGLRKALGDDRLPVDVDAIALAAGFHLYRFDLGASTNEMFMGETILLDPKQPGAKFLRWLKAHALGHAGRTGAPRGGDEEWRHLQGPGSRREEATADLFARHLLIPIDEWLEAELEGGLPDLEDHLRVPSFALRAYARDIETGLFVPGQWAAGPLAEHQRPVSAEPPRVVVEQRGGEYWSWEPVSGVAKQVRREMDDLRERGQIDVPHFVETDGHYYRWYCEALEMATPTAAPRKVKPDWGDLWK